MAFVKRAGLTLAERVREFVQRNKSYYRWYEVDHFGL
jgi:hypothetical protein